MKIELLDNKGIPFNLVRFCQANDLQLLIYIKDDSLDEQGHITIHISTIGNEGAISANAVPDDRWDEVKGLIKNIVNANKNSQPLPVEDLDYNVLNGISLNGDKALKLMSNYVELLKANQPVFEKQEVANIVPNSFDNVDNTFENVETSNDDINMPSMAQEMQTIEQNLQPEYQPVYEEQTPAVDDQSNVFNNFQPEYTTEEQIQPVYEEQNVEGQDYQSMYFEQVQINNQLRTQISEYENKLETLKNIINN